MTDPAQELAELRSRLTLLEARVDGLAGPLVPIVPVPDRPAAVPAAPPTPIRFADPQDARDWTETLLDPRLLGWAGAVLALLGGIFFLIYAANNGWITPQMRVEGGALLAAGAFLAGLRLRAGDPDLVAARVVTGLGAAGLDLCVLAGGRVYHLLTPGQSLLAAAVVAAAATAAAWWADDDLLGAYAVASMLAVPALAAGETTLWTAWIVLATSGFGIALAAVRRWSLPAVAVLILATPQLAIAAARLPASLDTRTATAIASVLLLAVGGAVLSGRRVVHVGEALTCAALAVALVAAFELPPAHILGLSGPGVAMLGVAALYAFMALAASGATGAGETAIVSGLIALGLLGAASAMLLGSHHAAWEWAAESIALAVAYDRLRRHRYAVVALTYAGLAAAAALAFAPPTRFAIASPDPARGLGLIVAAAAAILVLTWALRRSEQAFRALRIGSVAAVGYAAALAILGLSAAALGSNPTAAEVAAAIARGQVLISGGAGVTGLALAWIGIARRSAAVRGLAALVLLAAAAKLFIFDLATLSPALRAVSFGAVGAALVVAAWVSGKLAERTAAPG